MARFNKKNERASFIVECFEEFYRQVLQHKRLVSAKPWQKQNGSEGSSPEATAEYILSKLQTLLEEKAIASTYAGNSFLESYYDQAQYLMVSLADETFLSLDWPGKVYWESNLLEQRVYNTHSAGQVIFKRIDKLLKNKDPVSSDLAILYLNALGLGFMGKYRHFNDKGDLKEYRTKLFTFINRREPYLFNKKTHLFPDAYSHTLEGDEAKELPNMRNWYFMFGGIGLTYLLVSYIIWYSATFEITRAVNRVIAFTTSL